MLRSTVKDNKKTCRKCLNLLDVSYFGSFLNKASKATGKRKRYINSRCKDCASMTSRKWSFDNKHKITEKWHRNKKEMLDQIYQAYGNMCACCSEKNRLFLTIDHVNNDGYKERPRNKKGNAQSLFSGHYYKRIIKAGFPPHLQILCWNCNCGKSRNKGVCPHKDPKCQ